MANPKFTFETIVTQTSKDNIKEKISPYVQELLYWIDRYGYGDFKIKTSIEILSDKEFKINVDFIDKLK